MTEYEIFTIFKNLLLLSKCITKDEKPIVELELDNLAKDPVYRIRCEYRNDTADDFTNFNITLRETLTGLFTWEYTRIGHMFWETISIRMEEYEDTRIENPPELARAGRLQVKA